MILKSIMWNARNQPHINVIYPIFFKFQKGRNNRDINHISGFGTPSWGQLQGDFYIKQITICTVQWFLAYLQSCAAITIIILEHFYQPKKLKTFIHYQSFPNLSTSQPQATTNLLSFSMNLPILDISYKMKSIICGLL